MVSIILFLFIQCNMNTTDFTQIIHSTFHQTKQLYFIAHILKEMINRKIETNMKSSKTW